MQTTVKIDHTFRRVIGLTLGALLGLTFGLVSQTINMVALPGISFYQPPFGPWANTALCVLSGALLGLLNAWPIDGLRGTLLASGASAVVFAIATLLSIRIDPQRAVGTIMVIAFLGLPFFGFLVPLIAVLRWTASQQEEAYADATPLRKRLVMPLVLLIVVGLIGRTSLYSLEARQTIIRMDTLIKTGQQVQDVSRLPSALRPDDVADFIERARGPYTLEWKTTDLSRYAIPIPISSLQGMESGVIARFANGWTLVCIFVPDNPEPGCKSF